MTRIWWRLVDAASQRLESDERDAVRGDFAESGETAARALRGVLGLVVRRQAELWRDWRPWLALAGLALPLGLVLSLFIRNVAASSAIYIWMYSNWWTTSFLTIPGARIELAGNIGRHMLSYLTLGSWAWTCGFVLSSLSRRTVWVNGSLFCLVLFGAILAAGQIHPGQDSVVWSLTFFRVVFPILLRTLLLVVPALWGMQIGFRRATLPVVHTVLLSAAIAGMTMQAADSIRGAVIAEVVNRIAVGPYTIEQGRLMLTWDTWLRGTWPLRVLPLVVMWPAGYV